MGINCTPTFKQVIPRASRVIAARPLLSHLPLRLWLSLLWARLVCRLRGCDFTKRAWVEEATREVGEVHCGCTRCDIHWQEDLSGRPRSAPRHVSFFGPLA